MSPPRPRLSVLAPCYNEAGSLPDFAARMTMACQAVVGSDYELVLVNDGSRDETWSLIQSLAAQTPQVVGVNLARNHGHQLAVTAGLSLTRGERVLIIDADLQDPPELLAAMMARMDEGFDVVFGRRRTRANETRFKLWSAALFYRFLRAVSNVEIPADTGDFRLVSRRIVERLKAMPEHDRFLRGMVAWLGGRQSELLYDRDARLAGETGYTLRKMVRLAMDALVGFSNAPLRLASLLALLGVGFAIAMIAYVFLAFFLSPIRAPGYTSLALLVILFSTAQLTCLAILGEYVGRAYMQTKGRPLFLIEEVVSLQVLEAHKVRSFPTITALSQREA
ncbi:MAG: glycosyltransferase family 2 protein [Tabrizicola sp.]|nr:glycosyltransferase family 2 protein [Tabrizicola sp.]MDP3196648.1 glycosyltransferase family 2 protein [Tabrizicola sp.]